MSFGLAENEMLILSIDQHRILSFDTESDWKTPSRST